MNRRTILIGFSILLVMGILIIGCVWGFSLNNQDLNVISTELVNGLETPSIIEEQTETQSTENIVTESEEVLSETEESKTEVEETVETETPEETSESKNDDDKKGNSEDDKKKDDDDKKKGDSDDDKKKDDDDKKKDDDEKKDDDDDKKKDDGKETDEEILEKFKKSGGDVEAIKKLLKAGKNKVITKGDKYLVMVDYNGYSKGQTLIENYLKNKGLQVDASGFHGGGISKSRNLSFVEISKKYVSEINDDYEDAFDIFD